MPGFIKKIIQLSLMLIAFLSISNIVFAQEYVSNSISSVDLSISPTNPRVGDSVTLTLSSDSLDLNSSKIVWYIDGVARKETTNKSITINTKNSGDKTTIRVIVQTVDGIIKEVSKEISPAGVDLVVEPMSYTLPFYKGKPLFVAQGKIKIVAISDVIIDGVKIGSKDLNFKWIKDGSVLGSNSGKGKDSIIINSTIPVRDINIDVQILDELGNILVETSKLISKNNPKILFYENNPLYGILYNNAIIGNYYLGTKEELTIIAKPFSFSFLNDTPEESDYAWYVNGNYVPPTEQINKLILKQTTNLKGISSILLNIKNIDKMNQYASGNFNIEFGQ
jgi:hypothetical protein